MFNVGYTIILVIIISFLPTFPINHLPTRVAVLFNLAISQILALNHAIFIMLACLIVGRHNSKLNNRGMRVDQQRLYLQFRSSFGTLMIAYFIINLSRWYF